MPGKCPCRSLFYKVFTGSGLAERPLRTSTDVGEWMQPFCNRYGNSYFKLPALGILGAAAGFLLGPGASGVNAKSAIVGGKSISIKDAPWQLLLEVDEGNGATALCGAVWIGERWVITAAHCVEDATTANASIYAGITRHSDAKKADRVRADRILANPDFPKTWKDIAVIHLASDITAPMAKPIPFATPADVKLGLTNPGTAIVATGWGGTNRDGNLADSLQMVKTTIHDTDKYVIEIAADGTGVNKGACGGDSGGPFVVKDAAGTGWIVAGLSSFITSYCGDPKSPSSYTRVSSFASWIQQNTGMATGGIADTPRMRAAYFTRPGRIHLDRAQRLDIAFVNAAGAVVGSTQGYFEAGDHDIKTPDQKAQGLSVDQGILFPRLQAVMP
jgi:secreted trypsin-like serine protease